MAITDELRSSVANYPFRDNRDFALFEAIADRIDAALAERYVELPKDADGEYIHIGDRMENNERVARIVLTDDSWEPSVYLEKLPNFLNEYFCSEISHYHAPTVEDVLREFAQKMNENMGMYTGEAIDADEWRQADSKTIAEYAPKLKLAGGDAE